MKYRRLSPDELQELEPQFIRFLASNTITADDWVKLKQSDPKRVEGLIEIFSDIVFQQTLEKLEYLEFKTRNDIKVFHCQKEKIVMRGLLIEGDTDLDLTKNNQAAYIMQQIQASNASIKVYTAEKKYTQVREQELFMMMNNGCLISNELLFNSLSVEKK